MNFEEEIKLIVEKNINCDYFELINESKIHHGHAGDDGTGQTHFKLVVVSDDFSGQSRLQRHARMNELLKPLFSRGLHSITYKLSPLS